jgi:ankyrin repeat protein
MKKSVIIIFTFCVINSSSIAKAEEIDIFEAARENNFSAIKAYTQKGKDINIVNSKKYTPFILAAYYGHIQTLDILLQTGAETCTVDNKGNNAFMGVAFKGHEHVAKWLLENTDCNVNHQNYAGQTAMMMASLFGRGNIIKLLLEHGANPEIIDKKGNTASKLAQAQGLLKVVEIIKFHIQ